MVSCGFKHFGFSPLPGEDSHFDDHIFQWGWFNHQLDDIKTWVLAPSEQDAGVKPSNFTLSVLVKLMSRARRVDYAFELAGNRENPKYWLGGGFKYF